MSITVRTPHRTLSMHRTLARAIESARKWSRYTPESPRIAVSADQFSAMLASGEIYETVGGEFIDRGRQWVVERA